MNEEVSRIKECPVCGNETGDELVSGYYPCECGTYLKPIFHEETLHTHSGDWAQIREDVRKRLFSSAQSKLSKISNLLSEEARLLDIGCGTGEMLIAVKEAGYQPVGLDANPDVAEYCKKNISDVDTYEGFLNDQNFPESSFDAVTISHVIEHIPKPNEFLNRLSKLLKRGGVVYIGTPNVDSHSDSPLRSQFGGLNVPDHKILYTPSTLKRIIEENGYEIINITTDIYGFDFTNALRRWIVERLKLRTNLGITRKSKQCDKSNYSKKYNIMRKINSIYSKISHACSPLIEVILEKYINTMKENETAPMIHCVCQKPTHGK